jgi:hypothetical protein
MPDTEKIKNIKSIDEKQIKQYIVDRYMIIENMKNDSLFLASTYQSNIKIEIDVNPHMRSVKISVKEFC